MSIYTEVSLEKVFQTIDPKEDLFVDTETIGKYGKIRLIQFYQRDWNKALIVNNPDALQLLINFNSIKECNLVMQYAAYDISTIQAQTGSRWIPKTFSDTFFLARLAFPYLDKYSLDDLIKEAMGTDPYTEAGLSKAEMHKAKWDKLILDSDQLLYGAMDVYYLPILYDKIKHQADSLNYRQDIKTLRCALDFQCNGLPVDKERLLNVYKKNVKRIAEIDLPINCNSYQQVRPYIGSEQSDAEGLARLGLQGNQKAIDVQETRKLVKQNSFINKYDTEDNMIYGHFVPSTRSGRFSCSDDNLQQIPRALKGCFGYIPEDNKVLIYSDYSGLELRCIAAITGDPTIVRLLREGVDLHNYVAEMIFGVGFTKLQRQITKNCNFNLLYGGGVNMLQKIIIRDANIFVDIKELEGIVRKWKSLFPGLIAWQKEGIRAWHRGSLGITPFGRRYKGRMYTDQLNIQNQGFGAEVAKLAMGKMYPDIKAMEKEHDARLANFIHDSYMVGMDNHEEAYVTLAKQIGDHMHNSWFNAIQTVQIQDIPMPVSVYVGYNWGDIENGDYFHKYEIGAI